MRLKTQQHFFIIIIQILEKKKRNKYIKRCHPPYQVHIKKRLANIPHLKILKIKFIQCPKK